MPCRDTGRVGRALEIGAPAGCIREWYKGIDITVLPVDACSCAEDSRQALSSCMQTPSLTVNRITIMGRPFAKDVRSSTLPNWPEELQEAYDDLTD